MKKQINIKKNIQKKTTTLPADSQQDLIKNNQISTKTFAVILGAVSVLYTQHKSLTGLSAFPSYKFQYSVKFDSMFEEAYRERIFLENVAKIKLHNSESHHNYKMGVNQFTLITDEQFVAMNLGLIAPEYLMIEDREEYTVGEDIDWFSKGVVTAVKEQGQCGSSWAFSTTGSLESLNKLAYGTLESFSEQQLVNCSGSYGNMACSGGLMDNAFKYVKDNGIVHESEYAYKAVKQTCSQDGGPFKISGFSSVRSCNKLTSAIAGRPVSIAFDATNWSRYSFGVFDDCNIKLNHGALLVGIISGSWYVKNFWGPTWGEKGFIRLAFGNTCGLCNMASYPNK